MTLPFGELVEYREKIWKVGKSSLDESPRLKMLFPGPSPVELLIPEQGVVRLPKSTQEAIMKMLREIHRLERKLNLLAIEN